MSSSIVTPGIKRDEISSALLIPEVLTHILSFAPPVQLLTGARLVCKRWKHEIESNPILRWRYWVPNRDLHLKGDASQRSSKDNIILEGISLPPPSIRGEYSNLYCKCGPSKSGSSSWACEQHVYTSLFELHPVALHFLQIFWKRFMRMTLAEAEEIVARNSRDALMDELVVLIKPKLREFETAILVDTPEGIRLNTSNRLIRPETLSQQVFLYCGVQHESLIETVLYDNGAQMPIYCQSSRTSRRKMLAVKDLAYNVMHRSLFGDVDLNEVRRKRTMVPPVAEAAESSKDNGEDLPRYYSVIVQIESKSDPTAPNLNRGSIEDTEVEITLALFEPFDIVSVKTRRLAESTQAVRQRCIARFSGDLEPQSWKNKFLPYRMPWRVWARDKKPKAGDQMPNYDEVQEYYRAQAGIPEN
ncbi:hypothetical protein ABW20_dc0109253 [Dactylellina cionopaga]|nr:hypothetical protein ABW20_dc0109253 [Dactylellina cionopaga]